MQLGNKYGELPYNYKTPIRVYLQKVCKNIVKNEGVTALFEIHPDKEIFEAEFLKKSEIRSKNIKESKSHTQNYKEAKEANPQLHSPTSIRRQSETPYAHFTKKPLYPFSQEIESYSNFFGSKEESNSNSNRDNSSNVAIWLIGVVILCMLSFFLMHLLKSKN